MNHKGVFTLSDYECQSDAGHCPVLMLIHTERKQKFSLLFVL